MPSFSGALANFGLGMRGINDANVDADADRRRQQDFEAGQQATRIREQGLDDAKQQAILRGQSIESGKIRGETERMGLEDLTRTRARDAAMRAAVSGADPEAGRAGMYENVATAARGAGDLATDEKAQAALKALRAEGFDILAKGAISGLPPAEVEAQFNRISGSRIAPGTLQYGKDPKSGDILINAVAPKDGKPYTFNVSAYMRVGTKPDIHVVPAGASVAESGAGRATTIIPGPADRERFAPNTKVEKVGIYNEDGQKVGEQLIDLETRQPIAGTGGTGAATGERSVAKALPEIKEAMHHLLQTPGMATKVNPDNPMDTQLVLTEQGRKIAPRLETFVMANKKVPPAQALLIVMHGEPRELDGKPVVRYGGKEYSMSAAGGTPVAKPAPKPRAAVVLPEDGGKTQIPENEFPAYRASQARAAAGIDVAGNPTRTSEDPAERAAGIVVRGTPTAAPAVQTVAAPARAAGQPTGRKPSVSELQKFAPAGGHRGRPADPDFEAYKKMSSEERLAYLLGKWSASMTVAKGETSGAGLGR